MTLWPQSLALMLLSATSVAALLRHRVLACILGAGTLLVGMAHGNVTSPAAASLLGMALLSAAIGQLPPESALAQAARWGQLAALAAFELHLIDGFARFITSEPLWIRPDAIEFRPSYNIDKALAAACVLAFADVARTRDAGVRGWLRACRSSVWPTTGFVALMILPAVASGFVRFDPQLHPVWPYWLLHNFALVSVPQETLFRGLLPERIASVLPKSRAGAVATMLVSSALFGARHLGGGLIYALLSTLAGVGYAVAAKRAGGIVGSVVAHLALNSVHFALFTYPALRR